MLWSYRDALYVAVVLFGLDLDLFRVPRAALMVPERLSFYKLAVERR